MTALAQRINHTMAGEESMNTTYRRSLKTLLGSVSKKWNHGFAGL